MKPETNAEIAPAIKSPAATEPDFIDAVVKRYEGDEGMLIPMLQDIQAEYGYLPADHLRSLSKILKVPLARIYGVATFYASFRLSPKGQHDVTLCMGTVCYLKGSARISEVICGEYGVEPGGTTKDRLFTLNLVNCVGACALAPVMIVDGKYHAAVTPESALKILRGLPSGEEAASETESSEKRTAEGAAVEKKPAKPAARGEAREIAGKEREAQKEVAAVSSEPAAGASPEKPHAAPRTTRAASSKAENDAKSEAKPGARRASSGKGASPNTSGIKPAAGSKTGSKKKTGKR